MSKLAFSDVFSFATGRLFASMVGAFGVGTGSPFRFSSPSKLYAKFLAILKAENEIDNSIEFN